MPEELLSTFEVKRLSILDEDGNIDAALMPPLDDGQILAMHEKMVLARTFDERAVSLQREGRIGTYPPLLGQEAAQVGSAAAIDPGTGYFHLSARPESTSPSATPSTSSSSTGRAMSGA